MILCCESLRLQQIATAFHDRLATTSLSTSCEPQFPTCFNTDSNLVRDQGVGGSNPLSPTNIFKQMQSLMPGYLVMYQVLELEKPRQYWVLTSHTEAAPTTVLPTTPAVVALALSLG